MNKRTFLILALCMFSSTLGMGIVIPLLPLYAENMGATGIWLGLIVAAYYISNSVFVPIAGRFSDQRGRKLFLTIGLLAYSIISLGYVWADNVTQLCMVRLIHGIAGAMTIPIAMAYLGDLSPEGEEGKWMGYANIAFFSGFGFGPLMGGVLTDHFGITTTFYTMSGLNMLAFLIALLLLSEVSRRKIREDSPTLSFREMGRSSMIKGLFSFRLVQALGRGGIATFLPIFAATAIGLSPSLIGTLLAVNFSSWLVFTPLGGLIADKVNRRTITILGSILFVALLAAIPMANSFWQLLTVLFIQAIGGALSMPAASALTVEEGRRFGMGSTMSVFFLAMGIGMTLGPIISGLIHDWFDINSVFYFGAVVGLMGTGLFAWFTRQYRERKIEI